MISVAQLWTIILARRKGDSWVECTAVSSRKFTALHITRSASIVEYSCDMEPNPYRWNPNVTVRRSGCGIWGENWEAARKFAEDETDVYEEWLEIGEIVLRSIFKWRDAVDDQDLFTLFTPTYHLSPNAVHSPSSMHHPFNVPWKFPQLHTVKWKA